MGFNACFNSFSYIAAASAPIHAFLEFLLPVPHIIFFPSHLLLFHITIVETTDSGERGMNHVEMTIINPRDENWPSSGSNQRPPVLKSTTLPAMGLGWTNRGARIRSCHLLRSVVAILLIVEIFLVLIFFSPLEHNVLRVSYHCPASVRP